MNKRIGRKMVYLLSLMFFLLVSGCTHMMPVPEKDLTCDFIERQPYDATLKLVLPTAYCDYVWIKDNGLGDTFKMPLGKNLCFNAESMFKKAFTKVITTHDNSTIVTNDADMAVEAKLISFDFAFGMTVFHEAKQVINVEWTMTDPGGNIIWVDTIQGVGTASTGGIISYKNDAKKNAYKLTTDLYKKTYEAIIESREIQNYVLQLRK